MKFNLYVDGLNLYYALKEAASINPTDRKCYWLNLLRLGLHLETLLPGFELNTVKYFTSDSHNQKSFQNQKVYLDALSSLDRLQIIKGHFKKDRATCQADESVCKLRASYDYMREKMTDVAIGVTMVKDIIVEDIQGVVLITRDTDQIPTLEVIEEVVPKALRCVVFPPSTKDWPKGLIHSCSSKNDWKDIGWTGHSTRLCMEIGTDMLKSLRLGPKVKTRNGTVAEPQSWVVNPNL